MDEDRFKSRLFAEAMKISEGRSDAAEILAREFDSELSALNQELVLLSGANQTTLSRLQWMLAGVVGKAKLVGAIGPMSEAVRRATKEPARARSSKGGRTTGENKRLEREETWEPHAKKLAMKARAEDPRLSQEDVARYIYDNWGMAEALRMKHATFLKLVAQMERDGSLPKRAK